jgi:dipeptidyl aminopeptidase/acylaminoacyl peptidase
MKCHYLGKCLKSHVCVVLVLLYVWNVVAATPVKETFTYAVKNGVDLRMDKYAMPGKAAGGQPCVIFMFGGSFRGGTRDSKTYLDYFNDLAGHGYTVVSIDYRLGLKDVKPQSMAETVPALKRAIDWAVEDLYDATTFALKHAGEWNINPAQIIISGSSAGAIAVLQAEYERCNSGPLAANLPRGFRYAGVVGFAGAILAFSNTLQWEKMPAPTILFHGDADDTVPFAKLKLENIMFCGSQEIKEQLDRRGASYALLQFAGNKHEVSSNPLKYNLPEVRRLIEIMVLKSMPVNIHALLGKPGVKSPDQPLSIEDFIKTNFK